METWKPIEFLDNNYEVSNLGRVRSTFKIIKRSSGRQHTRVSKILKPATDNRGYLRVAVSYNNKLITLKVHRVVAEVFIGKSELTVNHIDGNKQNNRVENLEWMSALDNVMLSFKTGQQDNFIKKSKERCKALRKISYDMFLLLAKENNKSASLSLSKKYGVDRKTLYSILNKKTYKDYWDRFDKTI